MIDVTIVEDNHQVRETLALIISGTEGFSCQYQYSDCESALVGIPKNPPSVVLMDLGLPGKSGIEGIRELKQQNPDINFIVLTVQEDNDSIIESLRAGATGYLLKNTEPAILLQSIKEVSEGGSPMSTAIARKVVESFRPAKQSPLSERETEILQKLCDGNNYKAIAESLFISGHTVRIHIRNIYAKLHVHSRAEAVKKAINNRIV